MNFLTSKLTDRRSVWRRFTHLILCSFLLLLCGVFVFHASLDVAFPLGVALVYMVLVALFLDFWLVRHPERTAAYTCCWRWIGVVPALVWLMIYGSDVP